MWCRWPDGSWSPGETGGGGLNGGRTGRDADRGRGPALGDHRAAIPPDVLEEVAASVGTPAYVYDAGALDAGIRRWIRAARRPERIWYSVKANSNRAVLRRLAGYRVNFEVATHGEHARVRAAGIPPRRVLFGGVPKGDEAVRRALGAGVDLLVLQAWHEVEAAAGHVSAYGPVPVGVRVRAGIRAGAHPSLETAGTDAKFGFRPAEVRSVWARLAEASGVVPRLLAVHLGSGLDGPEPYLRALDLLMELAGELEKVGPPVREMDFGGGLGFDYEGRVDPDPAEVADPILERTEAAGLAARFEPGRSVVAGMGVLLSRALYRYDRNEGAALVCDAAFSDFSRFVLYGAYHRIDPVGAEPEGDPTVDVLGATCESGDVIGRARPLHGVRAGDLLVVRDVGAYGFTMASNYNSRRRPPEVMIDGADWWVVRRREALEDLWRGEGEEASA